jgi:hypothetical protein
MDVEYQILNAIFQRLYVVTKNTLLTMKVSLPSSYEWAVDGWHSFHCEVALTFFDPLCFRAVLLY